VVYQLNLINSSFAAIGRLTGVSGQTVRGALFQPSLRQEMAIADTLGIAVETLFPERYDARGNRIPLVRSDKATNWAGQRHGQKRRFA